MIFERDQLNTVVCNIRIPSSGGTEEIGTAIFIAKDSDCYLLTAAHVVKNINTSSFIIFSDIKQNPQKVDLSIILGGAAFINHPVADLAYV